MIIQILFPVLISFYGVFIEAADFQKCNTTKIGDCPENSECVEKNQLAGMCNCVDNFQFNDKFINKADYCLPIDATKPTQESNSQNYVNITSVIKPETPEPHHIISGIFIPIFIVLIAIGVIYGFKKYHLIHKLRERLQTRRQFHGIPLASDLDDPPLI